MPDLGHGTNREITPPPGLTLADWLARLDVMSSRASRRECVFTGAPVRQAAEVSYLGLVCLCRVCGATAERVPIPARPRHPGRNPPGWGRRWDRKTKRLLITCPGCATAARCS